MPLISRVIFVYSVVLIYFTNNDLFTDAVPDKAPPITTERFRVSAIDGNVSTPTASIPKTLTTTATPITTSTTTATTVCPNCNSSSTWDYDFTSTTMETSTTMDEPEYRAHGETYSTDAICEFMATCVSGSNEPQQRCYCDEICYSNNDCCSDAISANNYSRAGILVPERESLQCMTLYSISDKDPNFEQRLLVVSKCPSGTNNRLSRLCQQAGLQLMMPNDTDRNIVYANIYCGLCHGDVELESIETKIMCDSYDNSDNLSVLDFVDIIQSDHPTSIIGRNFSLGPHSTTLLDSYDFTQYIRSDCNLLYNFTSLHLMRTERSCSEFETFHGNTVASCPPNTSTELNSLCQTKSMKLIRVFDKECLYHDTWVNFNGIKETGCLLLFTFRNEYCAQCNEGNLGNIFNTTKYDHRLNRPNFWWHHLNTLTEESFKMTCNIFVGDRRHFTVIPTVIPTVNPSYINAFQALVERSILSCVSGKRTIVGLDCNNNQCPDGTKWEPLKACSTAHLLTTQPQQSIRMESPQHTSNETSVPVPENQTSVDFEVNLEVRTDHDTSSQTNMPARSLVTVLLAFLGYSFVSLSIVSLLVILITGVVIKKLRSTLIPSVVCLEIMLCVAYCFNLASAFVKPNITNNIPCVVAAVGQHFAFLATFTWMSVVALEITLKAWHPLQRQSKYLKIVCHIYAWLIPVVIVTVAILSDILTAPVLPQYGSSICWINNNGGKLFFFVVPITIISAANLIMFSISLALVRRSRKRALSTSTPNNSYKAINQLSLAFKLFAILGLGWIFGILVYFIDHIAVTITFIILNSLQGLFIAVMYFTSKNVRVFLCGICRKRGILPSVHTSTRKSSMAASF